MIISDSDGADEKKTDLDSVINYLTSDPYEDSKKKYIQNIDMIDEDESFHFDNNINYPQNDERLDDINEKFLTSDPYKQKFDEKDIVYDDTYLEDSDYLVK